MEKAEEQNGIDELLNKIREMNKSGSKCIFSYTSKNLDLYQKS